MTTEAGAGGAGAGEGGVGSAGGTGQGGAGGTGAGGAGAAAPAWHGLTDAAEIGYITNKGWTSPADMLRSYRGAEKLIGGDPETMVRLPRSDDPDGFRAVAEKLGMPKDAKAYEFDEAKDLPVDQAYLDWARGTFHKLGFTAAQAKQLTAAHNQFLRDATAAKNKDAELSLAADKKALEAEWRGGHDRMSARAKLAVTSLGLPEKALDALEESLGYAGTMKLLAEVGGKLGEDGLPTSGGAGGTRFSNTMTPDEAKTEWDKLSADEAFRKQFFDNTHPGHEAAKKKQLALFSIMYPEG